MYYVETTNGFGKTYRFIEAKEFCGEVWNIGRENFPFPKCIPLCTDIKDYQVNTDKLYFLEVESEELALHIIKAAQRRSIGITEFNALCEEFKSNNAERKA